MSEAATRERAFRQRWAVPGSRHDRLVRFAKIALPSAVGVLIAILAFAPLDKEGDVSFILDKKKVDNAPERMRVEAARYVGEDNRGQKFSIEASVGDPAQLRRADRRHQRDDGPAGAGAGAADASSPITARYDLDAQKIAISGPVRVIGPDGYRLETARRAGRPEAARSLASAGAGVGRDAARPVPRRRASAPISASARSCSTAALA